MSTRYRCAYEASGNGIVERSHRSIKTMVERSHFSVEEAIYWYNVTPKDDCTESTAPAARVYRYRMRVRPAVASVSQQPAVSRSVPIQRSAARSSGGRFEIGDAVWVRRRGSRCFTRSELGVVTAVVSDLCVEVDGVPRHVRNLRPCQQRQVRSTETRERAARRGASLDESSPLLVTLPETVPSDEMMPSHHSISETARGESQSRAVFTLPSRSAAGCLRVAPPQRQM